MMFIRIKYILILLSLCVFSLAVFGQEKEMREAYKDFNDLQFHSAVAKYLEALDKLKEEEYQQRNYATYMIAECYRMMNDYEQAELYYKDLLETEFSEANPVINLRWAEILQSEGEPEKAIEFYRKYLKEDPRSEWARLGVSSCEWMMANGHRRARVNVARAEGINSPADDFAPTPYSKSIDKLVFTSNRSGATGKKTDEWWGTPFSDLFVTTLKNAAWSGPELLDRSEVINTELHEGTASFSEDFRRMYFTRCEKWDEKKRYCSILMSTLNDTVWSEPAVLFSDTSANFGQPAVTRDELTIIFSSSMKGGEGGKDLYMAKRTSRDEPFGKPESLGTVINTFGNDMFPVLFNDTILFFASNGLVGYGGLDIYKSVLRKNTWSKPENLLKPVNSGYDDFGFVLESYSEEGYMEAGLFTSNRPGGKGGDEIYEMARRTLLFTVSGQVKDDMTLLPLPGSRVTLKHEDGEVFSETTDANGKYRFNNTQVKEDSDYEISVRKENYFAFVDNVSTDPYYDDHDIQVNIFLEPIPEKPIVLPDILYPLDEWILLPQYQDSLRGLVQLMKENPTLVIELRSHTDSRASHQYNDVLSQKRAQSVVDFLISEGIEAGRLVAKGYGERVSRTLDRNVTREGYTFSKGTLLDDDYIYSLPTKEIQEAAFQLNRRTEFAVIAKDYKSTGQAQGGRTPVIEVVSDSTVKAVDYTTGPEGEMKVFTHINDFSTKTVISMDAEESWLGEDVALDLLRKGAIDRNDFLGNFDEIMVEGRIMEGSRVKLDRIRLGDMVVNDVSVRIMNGEHFVMDEELLSEFGAFSIDKEKQQIIFK